MSIERLAAADQVMLWADRVWPQEIGVLAFLDHAPGVDAVAATMAGRVHLVPRFRQLLTIPARRLGAPYWVDDPDFDPRRHIRALPLAPPADEATVLAATAELMASRLDPSRPLWEIWLMTGMPGGRAAMYARLHHCIADGIAGIASLAALLDFDAGTAPPEPEHWNPAPPPIEAELIADHRQARARARSRTLARLAHPVAGARTVARAAPALSELFAEPHIPTTSLDRHVNPRRRVALVRADLDGMKAIAHARGAKVNDVFLVAITGGLRELLRRRGETLPPVMRIYVPVSLRHGQYAGARGNQVAQMVVPLPVGVDDPGERLARIAAETAVRKARFRPSVDRLPTSGLVSGLMLWLINRQHVNVESANVPGPPVPLYLAGARILEMFPLLPLIGRVSLGVGGLSYAGAFGVAAVADAGADLDLDAFAAGAHYTLDALTPLRLAV